MAEQVYQYVVVGGGLAGASAVDGIRERDKDGSIVLLGSEKHLPYDRPPLSKKLWFGQKRVEDIFVHDEAFYAENGAEIALGVEVVGLDPRSRIVTDNRRNRYRYDKLLLATGGIPRVLDVLGGDLPGVCYYRYLDDYLKTRQDAAEGKSAVVIGGGFIGSELAAALNINKLNVTMVFPEAYIVRRVFPEGLGQAIQEDYIRRGVRVLAGDVPVSLGRRNNRFVTRTKNGNEIESDLVVVGVGIAPSVNLAAMAGLAVENGIVVNEYLRTSDPNIYAAGDNAYFPYQALGERMRIEHWDNALNQGKYAGMNMAGANEPFTYMPYFFSDLFQFGYEAVGDINSKLEIFSDWQKEFDTGVVYYLRDGKVRGAMMCNVWEKLDAARELIKSDKQVTPEDLRGAIK